MGYYYEVWTYPERNNPQPSYNSSDWEKWYKQLFRDEKGKVLTNTYIRVTDYLTDGRHHIRFEKHTPWDQSDKNNANRVIYKYANGARFYSEWEGAQ
ncbi:uncharacterized protein L199_008491 [Kwoniella botswanensis]|uniref:uncharacterized protein n=1 Tax=Kwoniella botswanensis TaxID=1268659 RepID=UPI00315D24B5